MKKYAMIKSLVMILVSIFLNTDIEAQVTSYASVPYSTGFENNALDSNWYTTSSQAGGRIRVWPSDTLIFGGDTAQAHTGNYWLGLDNGVTTNTYIQKEAWMGLNTAGLSGLHLIFWWSEWNDETEVQDGIYISDNGGISFTKVLDLDGAGNIDLIWQNFDLNLDSINTAHGLSFTASYIIKFQEYDNYYFAGGNDGFMFDDIYVGTVVTGTEQLEVPVISLYPNPSNGTVYLHGLTVKENIVVKNVLGLTVPSFLNRERNTYKIEWMGKQGMYLIEVNDGVKARVFKVMKY